MAAARLLTAEGIAATVFSVTSWSELARNGAAVDRDGGGAAFIARLLADSQGPIVAASNCVRAVPESVRAALPAGRRYVTLGTDGFGRSDTREALRRFFGVDAAAIADAARRGVRFQRGRPSMSPRCRPPRPAPPCRAPRRPDPWPCLLDPAAELVPQHAPHLRRAAGWRCCRSRGALRTPSRRSGPPRRRTAAARHRFIEIPQAAAQGAACACEGAPTR